MWLRSLMTVGLVLCLTACDDDDPVAPSTGSVEVTVTTGGDGTDPDGYTVNLDAGTVTEAIEVDGTVTMEDVDAGSHTVELTDLASNCSVDGDNPQSITVDADATESVTFSVTCAAAD